MYEVECPYCEETVDVNHDDGYGYGEDEVYHQQCRCCDKNFTYTTYVSYTHTAQKSDCLNDGEHDYQLSKTYPREYSRMVCSMCDDRKQPTPEERVKYELDKDRIK